MQNYRQTVLALKKMQFRNPYRLVKRFWVVWGFFPEYKHSGSIPLIQPENKIF